MNLKKGNSLQQHIDTQGEREKFVIAFNDTMLKIWQEQITLLDVIDTGYLLHSVKAMPVLNLRDFLADNIGLSFVGIVAQALDDNYRRYNH